MRITNTLPKALPGRHWESMLKLKTIMNTTVHFMHLNIPGDVMLSYEAAVEGLVGRLAG